MNSNPLIRRIFAAAGLSITTSACTSDACPEVTEKTVEPIEGCILTITSEDEMGEECVVVDLTDGECPSAENVLVPSPEEAVCGPLGPPEDPPAGSAGEAGSGGAGGTGGGVTTGGGGAVAQGWCCYPTITEYMCVGGRPFFVDGVARVAQLSAAAPGEHGTGGTALSIALRERIGKEWVQDGLMEHASIAAFARFALELMAVGAPLSMLRDTQAAMADEMAHAEACFAMARAYGQSHASLGPLDFGVIRADASLAAIVEGTVREGCIGETIAALIAQRAAESATEPVVKEALARIADDETRHAELAWRFVMWASAQSSDLRSVATAALEAAIQQISIETAEIGPREEHEPDLLAHGRLPSNQRRAMMRAAVKDVLLPCLASLREEHGRAPSRHPEHAFIEYGNMGSSPIRG